MSNSLWTHGPYSPWNSPGQNTGVGCLSLLQGIFPSQGSNPGLPHCRWILYQLSHKGSPTILEWVTYPFSKGSSQPRNRTSVFCIAGWFFTIWAMREAPLKWLSPESSRESSKAPLCPAGITQPSRRISWPLNLTLTPPLHKPSIHFSLCCRLRGVAGRLSTKRCCCRSKKISVWSQNCIFHETRIGSVGSYICFKLHQGWRTKNIFIIRFVLETCNHPWLDRPCRKDLLLFPTTQQPVAVMGWSRGVASALCPCLTTHPVPVPRRSAQGRARRLVPPSTLGCAPWWLGFVSLWGLRAQPGQRGTLLDSLEQVKHFFLKKEFEYFSQVFNFFLRRKGKS